MYQNVISRHLFVCPPFACHFEACLITWVFNLNLQPPTESRTASFYFDEYLMQKLHFFITKYNLFGRLVKHIRNWMSGNLRCLIFICPLMSYGSAKSVSQKHFKKCSFTFIYPISFQKVTHKNKSLVQNNCNPQIFFVCVDRFLLIQQIHWLTENVIAEILVS